MPDKLHLFKAKSTDLQFLSYFVKLRNSQFFAELSKRELKEDNDNNAYVPSQLFAIQWHDKDFSLVKLSAQSTCWKHD